MVQAAEDEGTSDKDDNLSSHVECLNMLKIRHNLQEGYESLNLDLNDIEEAEDELWTKGTEGDVWTEGAQGMVFLQASTTPSLAAGVSHNDDGSKWKT